MIADAFRRLRVPVARRALTLAVPALLASRLLAAPVPESAGPTAGSPAGSLTGSQVRALDVDYICDGEPCKGVLVLPEGQEPVPGVLVVPEWWGVTDFVRRQAQRLAEAGYVAFVVDMYGEGRVTRDPQQARQWATSVREHPDVARGRFLAAYDQLRASDRTLDGRIAAIGFCFGGWVVLTMAELGTDLDAVVSFHGSLPTEPVAPGTTVRAAILAANGSQDSLVSREQIRQFQRNLTAAGATWQFNTYGGARHAFTNPAADSLGMEALAYSPWAARRSWADALVFLEEAFLQPR